MAEFQIVAKAYVRMCESYPTCEGCPINEHVNDIDTCRCRVLIWPCKYESKIMSWAAEHPEPITVYDWLVSLGLLSANMWSISDLNKPIPADLAQKLGIEPSPKA